MYIFIFEAQYLFILPDVLVYANPVWPYHIMDGGRYNNSTGQAICSRIRRRSLVIKAGNKYFRSGAKFDSSRYFFFFFLLLFLAGKPT